LYDLDVTSLDRYNAYEFKFKKEEESVETFQAQVECEK